MDSYNQLPPPILPDLVSSPDASAYYPIKQEHHHQQQQQQQQQHQQQFCQMLSSPPPPQYSAAPQPCQPPQLPDLTPGEVIEEVLKSMENYDQVVLPNAMCLLFRFSIDIIKGREVCQAMSASPEIISGLYFVLTDDFFKNDDPMLCYTTGNLTSISKYEEGRAALLDRSRCPTGAELLIHSLNSRYRDRVIFAIEAVHNLLLDRRAEVQEEAKAQIKHGLPSIVQLLDNQCLMQNYEFKVIVLNCLQILAYGNRENRLIIKKNAGPALILKTIRENFDNQPTEKLIETACRVLKYLSACPENKIDIILHGGIDTLTECIRRNNQEILETCLWTLRNLSDVINSHDSVHHDCVNQLVNRLLHLLHDYADDPFIVTCALGILANLTCNNEAVKQFICNTDGTRLLLNTILIAMRGGHVHFYTIDREAEEILVPAIGALCHLMNQTLNPRLAEEARMTVKGHFELLQPLMTAPPGSILSDELSKAIDKLKNLICKN